MGLSDGDPNRSRTADATRAIERGARPTISVWRGIRIGGGFLGVVGFLYLVLASPISRQTEVSWAVPYGLLPIALLIGAGAWALEATDEGSVTRRDGLWSTSAGVAVFAVLRLAGVF